uniref:ABC transporter substrate-binding protein n=1 Tax=Roseiarcus sp. TaxID=1969460 RepID=UPI003F967D0C
MPKGPNNLSRRHFLRSTALVGVGAATTAIGIAPARAAPVEIQYFYRAAWPTSELYANWLIDEFNKKNGDRIHVTGASDDGETYKTKQTIEISSSDPPDVFYSWEGGRAGEIIKGGFAADLSDYYQKFGWDKSLNSASVSLAKFDGKPFFVPTEIGASVVWYRK